MNTTLLLLHPHADEFARELARKFPGVAILAASTRDQAIGLAPGAHMIVALDSQFNDALVAAAAVQGLQAGDHVDAGVLAAMKPGAYLVNVSRGGVIDEEALIDALRRGAIAGAGLDVFASEPLPADHPLWSLSNVTITPRVGGMSNVYAEQCLPQLRHNLRAFLAGDRAGMINRVESGI